MQEVRFVGLSTHLLLTAGYYLLYTAQAGILVQFRGAFRASFFCVVSGITTIKNKAVNNPATALAF